ncbi:SPX domain-containing protein [Chlamydoabsidia padenii]|nr:SPX domain-containing protein [Chlamydoabsidia padenii]
MKFAKHLETESVAEWRRAYIHYKGLKKKLVPIEKHRQTNSNVHKNNIPQQPRNSPQQIGLNASPNSRTTNAYSPHLQRYISWRLKRNNTSTSHNGIHQQEQPELRSNRNVMNRLYRSFYRDDSELGQVYSPPISLDLNGFDDILPFTNEYERSFITMLDQELDKISRFYNEKEQEAQDKFDTLKMQLELVKQYRQLKAQRKRAQDDTLEQRLNPAHWFHTQKPLNATAPSSATIKSSTVIDEGDHRISYRVARSRLKAAIIEYYRSLELLRSYKILNETGFQKILKKFDKTAGWKASTIYDKKLKMYHWVKSDVLDNIIKDTEQFFVNEFTKGHRRRGMQKLRIPENHGKLPQLSSIRRASFNYALGDLHYHVYRRLSVLGTDHSISPMSLDLDTHHTGHPILSIPNTLSLCTQMACGLLPVEFRDFFIADELNSLAFSLWMEIYFFCVYGWHWNDLDIHCNVPKMWVSPCLACLPPLWRGLQCLRRYYNSKEVHHLVNGLKYVTSIMATIFVGARRIHPSPTIEAFWIIVSIINSTYTSIWDIKMDWGWPIFTFLTAFLEAIRRIIWNFYRLENEHLNNCGHYRAIKEIPLPFILTLDEKHGLPISDHEQEEEMQEYPAILDHIDLADPILSSTANNIINDKLGIQDNSTSRNNSRNSRQSTAIPISSVDQGSATLVKPGGLVSTGSFYGCRDFETRQDKDDSKLGLVRQSSMVGQVLGRIRTLAAAPTDSDSGNDNDDDEEDDDYYSYSE